MSNFFYVRVFNPCYFLLLALAAVLCVGLILAFRKKSEKSKETAVFVLYAVTLVLFFVYKVLLLQDEAYAAIREAAGAAACNFINELPLNLCNINLILILFGLAFHSRVILSFNFFFGSLGALMALVMPTVGFEGYSLFLPRIAGYYITHFIILLQLPLLAGLGLYRPCFRDIPKTLLLLLALTALMTGLNLLIRSTGLSPTCNYFYTVDPTGNPLLELFYRWIPVPGLYLLPAAGIAVPFMLLVTALFRAFDRKKEIGE